MWPEFHWSMRSISHRPVNRCGVPGSSKMAAAGLLVPLRFPSRSAVPRRPTERNRKLVFAPNSRRSGMRLLLRSTGTLPVVADGDRAAGPSTGMSASPLGVVVCSVSRNSAISSTVIGLDIMRRQSVEEARPPWNATSNGMRAQVQRASPSASWVLARWGNLALAGAGDGSFARGHRYTRGSGPEHCRRRK